MVPAPITAAEVIGIGFTLLRDLRNLARLALGKELIHEGAVLPAVAQFVEPVGLDGEALVGRQGAGRLDAFHDLRRRVEPAARRRDRGIGIGEKLWIDAGHLLGHVANQPQGTLFRHNLAREADRTGFEIVDDGIDGAPFQRLGRAELAAADDVLQSELRPRQAREALRAAGARQHAEINLRKTEPRVLNRDPPMAGKRDLEAATERGAVDRGDDRLRARLHGVLHVVERRFGEEHAVLKLGDIGAGDKGLAGADQHDRLGAPIFRGALEPFQERLAHLVAQRIHGRAVEREDGDVSFS